jgi:Glycosyl hydrolase family 115/Gylcosyl hydrolase family 115 C-terminal domain
MSTQTARPLFIRRLMVNLFYSQRLALWWVAVMGFVFSAEASDLKIDFSSSTGSDSIAIAGPERTSEIVVDTNDFTVVQIAANLFADDVQRVSGHRPTVGRAPGEAPDIIIAGTLHHSAIIDRMVRAGRLKDLDKITNRWEATLWQIIEKPLPGVDRAMVIAGSDRRGTAYGFMKLSEAIGVSPWYWWADVPAQHHDQLTLSLPVPQVDFPAVKYRGIFINDEDWGLNPWAAKTFDPEFKNIGPNTYTRVFELMLRLRLNYLWPAMHPCSTEFGSVAQNPILADKYGIVAGSSHCEPMLCNNVHWNSSKDGPWNYSLNRDTIHQYWEDNAKARSTEEAVWTLGIRGIHDKPMEEPPSDMPGKLALMDRIIHDQRVLLRQNVSDQWGPIAQCFVPYKEVLPIYDAGLKVPDDVTLVWVDDNFGYIRRLSNLEERQRSGGAGVYWHLSYYGPPHSYTWINTTPPALMWEELHKAWENDARRLWVINVGDIKPMEIGIDYFSKLAWDPEGSSDAQRTFLENFTRSNFGEGSSQPMADFLMDFYRLGTIHKPELMCRSWALSLNPEEAKELTCEYQDLLRRDEVISGKLSPELRDPYTEMVGFPARVLALTGLIFMADRQAQLGINQKDEIAEMNSFRETLEAEVTRFNTHIAEGKWNRIMPGVVTGKTLNAWNSEVRWPWGEAAGKPKSVKKAAPPHSDDGRTWHDAASFDKCTPGQGTSWVMVEGLGCSGRAMSLQPAASSFRDTDSTAPSLEYFYDQKSPGGEALIDFLPTFRIYPGMKLRVSISVDDGRPIEVEVPGSNGTENENGPLRSLAVQDNYVRARVPLTNIGLGKHRFTIRAIDAGAVIDRLSLP